jgi:DNA polymerase-1
VKVHLQSCQLLGHNLKGDARLLNKWGILVQSCQFFGDTMILHYVRNSTAESQGLKELSHLFLGWTWPTYRSLVGKGTKKLTLDKHVVEEVANYCGMDCVATACLYQELIRTTSPKAVDYYRRLELPVTRVLFDMELKGVPYNRDRVQKIDTEFVAELGQLQLYFRELLGVIKTTGVRVKKEHYFNPGSHDQVKKFLLPKYGIVVKDTKRSSLKPFESVEAIAKLLRYKELSKLQSTYTSTLLENEGSIAYPEYNQVSVDEQAGESLGIRTGRLSCSGVPLHQIPTRSETGSKLRYCFHVEVLP